MKVLLSWSGMRSKKVAEALHYWLKAVIQSVEPWMSEEDIEKGQRWNSKLSYELEKTRVGILCVTPENLNAPWLLFEAGALSKTIENTYVCPYLFGMEKNNLVGPLAQFQATNADEEDTKKMLQTINKATEIPLSEKHFDDTFKRWWPELESKLKLIQEINFQDEHLITMRGLPLGEAIKRVGLTDIENRAERGDYQLPPIAFYKKAKSEIVITGPTLLKTFHDDGKTIIQALDNGKKVCVMLLHPQSNDEIDRLSSIHGMPIGEYLENVVSQINTLNLFSYPKFKLRFFNKLPPFQGVMIDGDIEFVKTSPNDTPNDLGGEIRIQPLTAFKTIHSGLIVQLKKKPIKGDTPPGPFDSFAEDLREQWAKFTVEDMKIFNNHS
ncbi:MAG: TIR domain-containing protein [Chloroflexota bacterium]